MTSRRVLVTFMALAALSVAQLSWWILFQVRQASVQREMLLSQDAAAREASAPLLAKLEGEHRTRLRMFLSEGLFFLLLLSLGLGLIYRTLRRDTRLSQQQANFVSAVTHELKSPLASIALLAQTLKLRELTRAKELEYLGGIESETRRMDGLINNVLQTARLDSGREAMHLTLVQLHDAIDTALQSVTIDPRLKDRLLVEHRDAAVWVRIDPEALRTILRNLVDNAVKYSPEGKAIVVRTRAEADFGVLAVVDEGVGFALGEEKHLFDKFYRVGDELVRQTEGTGLGLYLVRTLARAMGGDALAMSPGINRGATFEVRLPKGEPA